MEHDVHKRHDNVAHECYGTNQVITNIVSVITEPVIAKPVITESETAEAEIITNLITNSEQPLFTEPPLNTENRLITKQQMITEQPMITESCIHKQQPIVRELIVTEPMITEQMFNIDDYVSNIKYAFVRGSSISCRQAWVVLF